MKAAAMATAILAVGLSIVIILIYQIQIDYRLTAFLPIPDSIEDALVADQIDAGPGSRVILAALVGAPPDVLAAASRRLTERWRVQPRVQRVDNGEHDADHGWMETLSKHRFLLVPDVAERVTPEALAASLRARHADLALGGRRVEGIVSADPLGLLSYVADRMLPAASRESYDGVWFDPGHERALILITGNRPPFDIQAQSELLNQLRSDFSALGLDKRIELQLAGVGVIAEASAARVRNNARALSLAGGTFIVLILWWAWRSPGRVIAGAIPLVFGIVCGLLAVLAAYEQVHGLTLAFGFTLLGVALDYPVHLFGHDDNGLVSAARSIRQPLLLGAASTLIVYCAIWLSSSPGLAQLGIFSAAGLAGAAAITLLVLPRLRLPVAETDTSPILPRLPHWPWVPVGAAAVAVMVLILLGDKRWQDDFNRLTPADPEQLAADSTLRGHMGAGDVRYLLLVSGSELEQVLQSTETLTETLVVAQRQGLLADWQSVTDMVPSRSSQAARRQAWPDVDEMARRLAAAGSEFHVDAFEPFLSDLAELHGQSAITPESWASTNLAAQVEALLAETPMGWRSLVIPVGLENPGAFAELLEQREAPAQLVDLKAVSESMVADYRREVLLSLLGAAALISGLLLVRLRRARLVSRILLAPLAAMLCTAAIMAMAHGGLTIVHLVALLLVGGIGLDFSLFANTLAGTEAQALRTRRATLLCALSSSGVFLILAQSNIGLLHMLGITVAIGILVALVFAWISRTPCPNR